MARRKERWELDRLTVMNWLCMLPLISIAQMELATGFTNNRAHRLLVGLLHDGLVVRCTLSGGERKQERWWLTAAGVESFAQARGLAIRWQVTEPGIMKLISRMPMVEAFYDLALRLWAHQGILAEGPVHTIPDLGLEPTFLTPDLELRDFTWYRDGGVDAVAVYSNDAWTGMVWAGPEVTSHGLRRKAGRALDAPGATWHEELGRRLTPAGWVVVCADRLSAAQAAETWPGDHVLAVTVDGRVEQAMRPGDFSLRIQQVPKKQDLGRPERAVRWAEKDPAVQGLNDALAYAVFRFIQEWRAATPAQLKQRFGERYGATVRELQKRRLITKLDGGFYLTLRGMRAVAAIDGVDYERVVARLGVFLNRNGRYRRQQQPHDQTLIDVMLKLESEGFPTFAGYRYLSNLPGLTQVAPDAVLCLDRKDDRSLVVRLELEFTATDSERMSDKLDTYQVANMNLDELVPSVWLFEDRSVAQRYVDADPYLLMMVGVLSEFFAGTSRGPTACGKSTVTAGPSITWRTSWTSNCPTKFWRPGLPGPARIRPSVDRASRIQRPISPFHSAKCLSVYWEQRYARIRPVQRRLTGESMSGCVCSWRGVSYGRRPSRHWCVLPDREHGPGVLRRHHW